MPSLQNLQCPNCEEADLWASGVIHSTVRLDRDFLFGYVVVNTSTQTQGDLLINRVVCHSCKAEWLSIEELVKACRKAGTNVETEDEHSERLYEESKTR